MLLKERLEGVWSKCYGSLTWLIRWGALLLMAVLLLSTLTVQTIVYIDQNEWAEILPIKIWVFVTLIALAGLFYLCRPFLNRLSPKQVFCVMTLAYIIVGLALIMMTTDRTRDDAATVFRSAVEINSGNLKSLSPGAYLYRYPHQLGLVSFERLVMMVIPIPSMVVFFCLNLISIIGINFLTWRVTDQLFKKESTTRYTILVSFAFLPQFFNILFVYGLIYGLFFGLLGVYCLCRYRQKPSLLLAIASVISLGIAYWIRNNYILLILSLVLILLLDSLKQKKLRPLALGLVIIGFGWGMNKATLGYYEHLSQQELVGTPKVTWLAMGLQDDGNARRQPGWYNHYVRNIYFEKHGNYKAIEEDAKDSLSESLSYFVKNPDYTWRFFKDKFLSTWTEATFESIWSGPSRFWKQPLGNHFAASLYHGRWLYRLLYQLTHAILLIIYAGAFFFMIGYKKGKDTAFYLYPFIYLAAGVVFHLLWETKSQYTSPYVYLLIPFSVAGLELAFEKWQSVRKGKTLSFK
ncbi:hypothetical protein [Streptococcus saliviloxodontae]|uniref:Glycosyltransferase RgtA/B/C/D-like domain-containing protein n=1 Tax=Streptococcus saliviloxodontae TaxID=1349416 RepID=A0ABS2PK72_9STRE|nr:hypothetical protein [Streptococcus saliviloxodontae]MBM7635687.1 hypothetical protein [Streptococcus saliviloxodontae]